MCCWLGGGAVDNLKNRLATCDKRTRTLRDEPASSEFTLLDEYTIKAISFGQRVFCVFVQIRFRILLYTISCVKNSKQINNRKKEIIWELQILRGEGKWSVLVRKTQLYICTHKHHIFRKNFYAFLSQSLPRHFGGECMRLKWNFFFQIKKKNTQIAFDTR